MEQYDSNGFLQFDRFQIDPVRRVLYRQGEAAALNPKALDLLLALIERRGKTVSKEELLDAVWPGQFVEENNLTVHIAALRKALGETKNEHKFIVTAPGKGYSFVAAVFESTADSDLIIEQHSVSRVLIEEHETRSADDAVSVASSSSITAQKTFTRSQVLVTSAVVVLLTFSVLGFVYWQGSVKSDIGEYRLTKVTSSGDVTSATITPDGNYAVFARKEKDGESLWLRQVASGSQQQVLSSKPVRYVGLAISPDGNSIYATIFSPSLPDPQIWRLPLLGGVVEEIGGIMTGAAVSFSPDGGQIAFTESRSSEKETVLLVSNSDGTGKRIVSRAADDTRSFPNFSANPVAWSPDGKVIACSVGEKAKGTEHRILLVDPQNGSERYISDKKWDFIDHLVWIDNDNLAFIEFSVGPSLGQVWSVSRNTGEVSRITNDLNSYSWLASSLDSLLTVQNNTQSQITLADHDGQADHFEPREIFRESGSIDNVAFASDGSVVFSSNSTGKREIWRVDPDGSSPKQLTVNANVAFGLTVSFQDDSIVFCSFENGKYVLKRIKFDGSDLHLITEGPEDVNPEFAPDGRSVVYQKGLYNKVVTLWRYSLDDKTGVPLVQTFASKPAISRDGSQIAYYFMDQENGGVWKIGLASAMDGSLLGKLAFPRSVNERRMRWHPDGTSIGQTLNEGDNVNLMLMPTNGGDPKIVSGLGKGSVNWFEWSRDGKQIAVSASVQQRNVVRITR